MTKIKKDNENQETISVLPRMSAEQYWEWRTVICEMQKAKQELEIERRNLLIAQQEIQIRQLQAEKIKSKVEHVAKEYQDYKKNYENHTSKLEKELKCTFKGKIVNPITYEIYDENTVRV